MKRITPLLVVLVCAVGCSESPEPSPAETSPSAAVSASHTSEGGECPRSSDADRTDASSTAYYYVGISHCWDSMRDKNTAAGVLRAKELMSVSWYEQQKEGADTRNTLQAQFGKAAEHESYSVPKVSRTVGDVDEDVAADKAVRGLTAEWSWLARDGSEKMPGGRDQQIIYLEKQGGQWMVVGSETTMTEEHDGA